ncbi:hypothetical protein [Devosia sp.]|uniref:hypothetical protein n=1 Tax=Devosia sp. TaxID=1871048 RepID=UPI003BA97EAA
MAKLALLVDDESRLGEGVLLPISPRASHAAFRNLGQPVLLYRLVPETMVMFIGQARLMSIEAVDRDNRACRIEQFARFDAEPMREEEARVPGVRWMLQLEPERFAGVIAEAEAKPVVSAAAEEAAAAFQHDARSVLAAYQAVYDTVLQNWDYRCAFTGEQFERQGRPHPHLYVVAIRPREAGGPVHVRNYLPMTAAAKTAWTSGHLTLAPDLSFVVNKRRIDPEFDEQLLPIGGLLPPVDPGQGPDEDYLAYHRTRVFGG